MTFEQAIRKSIKAYFNGEDPTELLAQTEGEMKYTRDYFDQAESDLLGKDAPVEQDGEEENGL